MKRILSLLTIIGSISFTACKDKPAATAQSNASNLPAESIFNQKETADLVALMDDYYRLKDALVNDNAEKADDAAEKLSAAADTMLADIVANDSINAPAVTPYLDTIKTACANIIKLDDISVEEKRIPFEKVSDATFHLLQLAELKNAGIYRQYCPMAFNDKGAYWLSNETDIRNPYFGKKMLECGEVTDTIK